MEDDKKILSLDEAYDAMFDFLDNYYERTRSEEIAGLLSDLQILTDGRSCDPAAMQDWEASVKKILNQRPRTRPYLTFISTPPSKK